MNEVSIFGVRIAYNDFPAGRDVPADTPTLVMIHGWCASHTVYAEQIKALKGRYRLVVLDLPGHGGSAKPLLDYSIVLFAEILLGFIQKLRIKKPILVGHSMGGCIAIEATAQSPDSIEGIFLIDPARIVPEKRITNSFEKTLRALEEKGFRAHFGDMMRGGMFAGPNADTLIAQANKIMSKVPEHVGLSAWRAMLDWAGASALRKTTHVPLAYLAGHHASNIRTDIQAAHPKAQWAQPLCGSHHPHMTSPREVNAMIETYIEQIMGVSGCPVET